jgi:lipoprotein-releasing system permease protein
VIAAFERMVAWRFARARRAEGAISVTAWLALIAMALSVATLIVVMSVMNGVQSRLVASILGTDGYIHVSSARGEVADPAALADALRLGVPGVRAAVPTLETQALLSGARSRPQGVIIRGVPPADMAALVGVMAHDAGAEVVTSGALADFADDSIILSAGMAVRLGLAPGEAVTLTAPEVRDTPFGSIPRQGRYTLAATVDSGVQMHDFVAFMPLDTARRFAGLPPGRAQQVSLFLNDLRRLDTARAAAAEIAGPDGHVWDWRDIERNAGVVALVATQAAVMFVILSLIILVTTFTIIATMIMLVKEKTADIAVLRTMGARRSAIVRIFVAVGAAVGAAGTAAGLTLGLAGAANADALRQGLEGLTGATIWNPDMHFGIAGVPSLIDPGQVAAIAGVAMALSLAATIYPAWRAARVEPVEALRYG